MNMLCLQTRIELSGASASSSTGYCILLYVATAIHNHASAYLSCCLSICQGLCWCNVVLMCSGCMEFSQGLCWCNINVVQYAVVVWGFPRVCAGAILMWFNMQWLCGVFPGFVLVQY